MKENPARHRRAPRFWAWGWVMAWMGVILATASWAYQVIAWSRGRFHEKWYGILIGGILLLALGWLAFSLFRQRQIQRKRRMGIGFGYAVLLGVLIYKFQNIPKPIEKIHLLEYGLLAPLVFRAVLIDVKDRLIYWITIVICLIGGIGDELFQGYLPNRVGDLEDLELNLWATAFGLGFVWLFYQTRSSLWENQDFLYSLADTFNISGNFRICTLHDHQSGQTFRLSISRSEYELVLPAILKRTRPAGPRNSGHPRY